MTTNKPGTATQQPIYGCTSCYEYYTYPADHLRVYDNECWCEECWGNTPYEMIDGIAWTDLAPFKPSLQADRDEALAKLAAIESQEPVIRISGGRVVDFNPNYGGSVSEGAFYAKPVPAGKPAVAVPDDRCKHGVRLPHECGACADDVDSETAVAWYAYESVSSILEPHMERPENPGGTLPASIQDAVQVLLDNYLAAAPSHSQQSADLIDEFVTQLAEKFPCGMSAGDVFAEVKSFKLDRCPSHESEGEK